MEIKRGEHVALIGSNGTGKTTILKIINRLIPKDGGNVALGSRVKVGYYDQEHQILSHSKTIFDEISDSYPDLNNTRIRNVLAAFLFTGEDVFKRIGDLSGGERGRVSLAKLMLSPANFLILDEPTNHLDIQSKEILEEALRNYSGTVLVVSHDRYFINRVATRIVELKDNRLYSFIGNYDYYESHRDMIYSADSGINAPANELNSSNNGITTGKKLAFSAVNPSAATSNANASMNPTANVAMNPAVNPTANAISANATVNSAVNSTANAAANPAAVTSTQLSNKERYLKNKEEQAKIRKRENDLKRTEKRITEVEELMSQLENEINLPENATNSMKLAELSQKHEALDTELMELYEKYYELEAEVSEN
jgi:ATP-binding cassette subfamily F protein 3